MKMLQILQKDQCFELYDDDVCIYRILQEDDTYVLKNAYHRKVAMLRPIKEAFALFQDKKKTAYEYIYETRKAGSFIDDKHRIKLEEKASMFTFYSGRMMGKDMLIGYENKDFIFQIDHYEDHAIMFLKLPEYAVYACLYYVYFMLRGKQYSEPNDFLSHLPEDMMSFV